MHDASTYFSERWRSPSHPVSTRKTKHGQKLFSRGASAIAKGLGTSGLEYPDRIESNLKNHVRFPDPRVEHSGRPGTHLFALVARFPVRESECTLSIAVGCSELPWHDSRVVSLPLSPDNFKPMCPPYGEVQVTSTAWAIVESTSKGTQNFHSTSIESEISISRQVDDSLNARSYAFYGGYLTSTACNHIILILGACTLGIYSKIKTTPNETSATQCPPPTSHPRLLLTALKRTLGTGELS